MNDCGIDTSADDVMREAIEIATHVRALPPRSSGSFSQSRGGGPFGAFDSGDEDWEGRPSGIAWSEVVPPTVGLLGWFAALWGLARRYGIMPARDRR